MNDTDKAVLIANVGNSDLGLDESKPFSKIFENIYEESKKIYESGKFSNYKPIILEPVIRKITESCELEKIHLYATRQSKPHPKDTFYIAEILREIFVERFGFERDAICIDIVGQNPSDFDAMLRFYEESLEHIENPGLVYVSVTGGTPAQNLALLINSLLKFGSSVQAIYKPENKGAEELSIGKEIRNIILKKQLEALLDKKLYTAAADLAERFSLSEVYEIKLWRAMHHRMLFDFNTAVKILEEIKDAFTGSDRRKIENKIKDLKLLEADKQDEMNEAYFMRHKLLIKELYENMKIKWEREEYADFLGRLYRFEEAVLRFIFEKTFKVSTEKRNGFEEFKKFIEEYDELRSFLVDERKIRRYDEANLRVLMAIMDFICKEKYEGYEHVEEVRRFLRKIDNVIKLRHKCIIGHGFRGVSKKDIDNAYEGDIIGDLEKIVKIILKL